MAEPKISLTFERLDNDAAMTLVSNLPVGARADVRVFPPQIGPLAKWFTVVIENLVPASAKDLATVLVLHRQRAGVDNAPKSSDNCAASAGGRCVNRSDGHQRCDEDECVVPADPGATVTGSNPAGGDA